MPHPSPDQIKSPEQVREVHHNIPQIMYLLIKAQITLCLWGRATGKTEGPGADYTLDNILAMPRSLGAVVSSTFDKVLMFIIPKLQKGWERYGYLENVHYWVRKFPPKELKRDRPYLPIGDPKFLVPWFNGSAIQIISLDRLGISNASDLDWIYGDEARLFKKDNFDEVINANRGNAEHFGHLSQHHSILLTTDMPRDQKGRWVFDYLDMVDQEVIDLILQLRQRVYELEDQLSRARSVKSRKKIQKLLTDFEFKLNEIRKGTVFVSEASTLDNVHALGIEPILNMKRNLSDYVFRLSVLNQRVAQVENGFYGMYDEERITYEAQDYAHIDQLQIEDYSKVHPDCRWYRDRDPRKPLHLGFDHNAPINWVITGQVWPDKKIAKQISALYVERPLKLRHLVRHWHEYYKYHQRTCPTVYYWYDHTSIGDNASKDLNFSQEIIKLLRELGWQVIPRYIGKTPFHRLKYDFWSDLFEQKREDGWKLLINRTTNEAALYALEQTEVKVGRDGFEKDKTKEKDKNFPQVEAPHATEAMDTLWMGILEYSTHHQGEFTPIMTG